MGDTWGISGPAFLVGYAVLAAVVLAVSVRARRGVVAGGPAAGPVGELDGRPHDVAYLNGGPELAVLSALTALRLRGAITSVRGTAQAVPGADPGGDQLERALYAALATPTNRKWLHLNRDVAVALGWVRDRLTRAGLLATDAQRRQVRGLGWWMAAVAGLGLVRMLAGIADGRPVALLVVALLVVVVITGLLFASAPTRTRVGEKVLAELRERHHLLAPRERPDWRLYGPAGAALGIGIYGAAAIWASDPAIAGELAAQRAAAASASGSDGGGGGSSSSSSCGGGGGCGGGGCGG